MKRFLEALLIRLEASEITVPFSNALIRPQYWAEQAILAAHLSHRLMRRSLTY